MKCSACGFDNPDGVAQCVCGQPLGMTVVKQSAAVQQVVLTAISAPAPGPSGIAAVNTDPRLVPVDAFGNFTRPEIILPSGEFERVLGWMDSATGPSAARVIDLYRLYGDMIAIPNPNGTGKLIGVSRAQMTLYRLSQGDVFIRAGDAMSNHLWIMYPGEEAFEVKPGDEYPIRPGTTISFGIASVGMTFVAQ